MKVLLNNKGVTLVEIITSFAIISILLIMLLSYSSNSFKQIFFSGNRTEKLNNAKNIMENEIASLGSSTENEAFNVEHEANQTISFRVDGETKDVVIQGTIVSVKNKENSNKDIYTFIPNEVE